MLGSGVRKITLVPLDATHKALVSLDDCAALRALGTPAGEAAASFTERRIAGYDRTQPMKRPNAAPGPRRAGRRLDRRSGRHLDARSSTSTSRRTGELTVGETVVDTNHRGDGAPNVHVALDADEARFVALLLETFARNVPPA